jgi:hypothetical protein
LGIAGGTTAAFLLSLQLKTTFNAKTREHGNPLQTESEEICINEVIGI